jgi:hypothetical protein
VREFVKLEGRDELAFRQGMEDEVHRSAARDFRMIEHLEQTVAAFESQIEAAVEPLLKKLLRKYSLQLLVRCLVLRL